jgi:D-alanine-D-alanine ligase-like ATP-grasp enzyme
MRQEYTRDLVRPSAKTSSTLDDDSVGQRRSWRASDPTEGEARERGYTRAAMSLRERVGRRAGALRVQTSLARSLGAGQAVQQWRLGRTITNLAGERRNALGRSMWTTAAHALGAEIEEIAPNMFEVRLNGAAVHVFGQRTPFADPVSDALASTKALAYDLLAQAGVSTPDRMTARRPNDPRAKSFLEAGSSGCVVKPVSGGGGGRGVTASVVSSSQLARAIRLARVFSPDVIVEREVEGDHYRFLALDGEVLDVLKRLQPTVCGDGVSTIETLMLNEYERRIASETTAGIKPFSIDLDCLFTLERQGLRPTSIPDAGQIVRVKGTSNISGPRECTTYRGPVSPSVRDEVLTAARVLGVRLAGVDVLSRDISQPLRATGGVVLEVNSTPGLFHHYNVAEPESASPVAETVLEALLKRAGA